MTGTRLHVWVEGLVQGVGFRHRVYMEACRLGLTGWVRNLDDGRVEAVFEGDAAVLESMLAWCAEGPVLARVSQVRHEWSDTDPEFADFEITFGATR